MGLKDLFRSKPLYESADDLVLPDEIPTNIKGKVLRPHKSDKQVYLSIVGEKYRPKVIQALAAVVGDNEFDIYLLAEPNNPHDKKAVAVMAGNYAVGYIPKPENAEWGKLVKKALEDNEVLAGKAKVNASAMQVRGYVLMDPIVEGIDHIEAAQLSPAKVKSTFERIEKASKEDEPETAAGVRSKYKKYAKTVGPLYAHIMWLEENEPDTINPNGQYKRNHSPWEQVSTRCEDLLTNAEEGVFASGPDAQYDYDPVGDMQSIWEAIQELRQSENKSPNSCEQFLEGEQGNCAICGVNEAGHR